MSKAELFSANHASVVRLYMTKTETLLTIHQTPEVCERTQIEDYLLQHFVGQGKVFSKLTIPRHVTQALMF
ncbi:hypothetical protein SAMN05421759_1021 [Roseivivax lentus]|uniref:Uncharacterized protein n=1 Tax=Roseivivax lentus TaxID=633194 RepID=A0A1N7KRK8_9RHOB|nr:hypothetical protein SAMN05421759_1021 [Roseivivax lentus]